MRLCDYLQSYDEGHDFGLRESTFGFYLAAIGSLRRFVGKEPSTEHLQRKTFNAFVDWLRENRAIDTARTTRGAILTIWKAAYKSGHAATDPDAVQLRRLRRSQRTPTAFNPEEIVALINALHAPNGRWHQSHFKNQVRRDLYFDSLIRTAYDSAFRLGDLLAVRERQVDRLPNGTALIRVTTQKTEDALIRVLSTPTVAAIDRHLAAKPATSSSPIVWQPWARREAFYESFRKLAADAGVRAGTFKWLRRAAVTWANIETPGTGQVLAGHKSPQVTAQSYNDIAQQLAKIPRPPELTNAVDRWRRRAA